MRYGPLERAAITAAAVLLTAALYATWRMLDSHGVFTSVTPGFAGTCRAVKTPAGPGAIVFDGSDAIVAAMDRRAKASPSDGLYLYDPTKPDVGLVKLAGTPPDFHPGGLDLIRGPDGRSTLMVINRRRSGSYSIDMFERDGAALKETGSIESGLLVSPSAITVLDSQSFYVVNDQLSKTRFGRWLDDTFALPRGDVLYFDGMKFLEVAKNLNSPAGVALSPDGYHLYVSEASARRLASFERNPFTGQLTPAGTLAIPSNLAQISLGPDGQLWLASQPKGFAMAALRDHPRKVAPSEVFRVQIKDGIAQTATLVYANRGEEISGSNVAAVAGGHLLIGAPYGKKLLDCRLP
jgi:hypothetical protein